MTTNQTIDGVSRKSLEQALKLAAVFDDGGDGADAESARGVVWILRALLDTPACNACNDTGRMHEPGCDPGACTACIEKTAAQRQPDPVLCKFYDVTDYPGLVRELVGHVAQLQDSAKRNVKPWEDTFPPTLLPAYIERVNAESAAAQPQGEPVAWLNVATGKVTTSAVVVMDWDDEKEQVQSLYAEQPAPVAVVMPRLEMAHVVRAHLDIPGCPVLTSNQCHALAMKLNACLDELKRLNPSL